MKIMPGLVGTVFHHAIGALGLIIMVGFMVAMSVMSASCSTAPKAEPAETTIEPATANAEYRERRVGPSKRRIEITQTPVPQPAPKPPVFNVYLTLKLAPGQKVVGATPLQTVVPADPVPPVVPIPESPQ